MAKSKKSRRKSHDSESSSDTVDDDSSSSSDSTTEEEKAKKRKKKGNSKGKHRAQVSSTSSSSSSSSESSPEREKKIKKIRQKVEKSSKTENGGKNADIENTVVEQQNIKNKGIREDRRNNEGRRPEREPEGSGINNRSKWDSPVEEENEERYARQRKRDQYEQNNRSNRIPPRENDRNSPKSNSNNRRNPSDRRNVDRSRGDGRPGKDLERNRGMNYGRERGEQKLVRERNVKVERDREERPRHDREDKRRNYRTNDRNQFQERRRDRKQSRSRSPRRSKKFPRRGGEDNKDYAWGKRNSDEKGNEQTSPVEKEKPNFGLSGKLTEDTNKVNGIIIKYAEPPEARKPKRRWRLYPFKGETALPTMFIHRQSCYLIGRDRKVCDLPIDHPSCSKQHAALQYRLVQFNRDDGTVGKRVRPYVIDLQSANGTFLNNKPIESSKYVELIEKDVIKFGFSSREYVLLHENSKEEHMDDDVIITEETEIEIKQEPNSEQQTL